MQARFMGAALMGTVLGLMSACATGEDGGRTPADTDGPMGASSFEPDVDTDDMDDPEGDPDPGDTDGDDGGSDGDPDDPDPEPQAPATYADLQQKSAHNAYERHEALIDQLVYHRIRSLELDLHTGDTAGDWFVYHDVPTATTCRLLSDCLRDVGAFVEAVPEHEVLTLWLDLKSDWQEDQSPAILDGLLDEAFGSELLTPIELMDACPDASNLHDAVSMCGWPTVDELRGRVIVMLTGGNLDPGSKLGAYAQEGTVGFVAPSVQTAEDVAKPEHLAAAVLNVEVGWEAGAQAALKNDYIVRVWGLNEEIRWQTAADLGVHHLATDKLNLHQDPWAITHDGLGGPFTCKTPGHCSTEPMPEPGVVVGIEVESGDLWNEQDSGWFQLVEVDESSPNLDETWTTLVSTPNSHVEPFAKGCLMARTSLEADAPNFAVCRPADEEPLRVQIRETAGGSTHAIEDDVVPGGTVASTSVAWIRLEISDDGRCATGWGAHRRDQWIPIAEHCFDQPLRFRGLAASSHDAGPVRFLFVSPIRFASAAESMDITAFAQGVSLSGASAEVFDGPIP